MTASTGAAEDIRAVLPPGIETVVPVAAASSAASCVVVVAPDLAAPGSKLLLDRGAALAAGRPVVLVTAGVPSNLLMLRSVLVDEVVTLECLLEDLPRAIANATSADRLLQWIEAQPCASDEGVALVRAVRIAAAAWPPIHTVKRLAALSGVRESTLERQWRQALTDRRERLSDYLRVIALAHVARRTGPAGSLGAAAREIGWEVRSLRRAARSLFGCTLTEITADPAPLRGWLSRIRRLLHGRTESRGTGFDQGWKSSARTHGSGC